MPANDVQPLTVERLLRALPTPTIQGLKWILLYGSDDPIVRLEGYTLCMAELERRRKQDDSPA